MKKKIKLVKKRIQRHPITEDVIDLLLNNSNYTCCCCKGIKSSTYVIHHIKEYSVSQDNNYQNLAVLCVVCHDLAHRNSGLATSLTNKQITKDKRNWEKIIQKHNIDAAAKKGADVQDADYLNIYRISELANQISIEIPKNYEEHIAKGLGQGLLDGGNSMRTQIEFLNIFKIILSRIDFVNLDDLLNIDNFNHNLIGKFCFFIGGLYGRKMKWPYAPGNPRGLLHFHRGKFYCEWFVDPLYVTSFSASDRFSRRSIFLVYGRIKNLGEKNIKGKKYSSIEISPLAIGTPMASAHGSSYIDGQDIPL